MTEEIKTHLKKDPKLALLLEKYTLPEIAGDENHFLALIDIITSQQLSTKAGATIFNRLLDLLKPKNRQDISPKDLLNLTHDQLRSAGLSNSKVRYVQSLSQAIEDNELNLTTLASLSNEDVFKEITKLKGLGPWSAEMFLIFTLKRPDIFSIGDLGLRTAVSNLYGINRNDHQKILELSQNWAPFRSYASRLLWKSLDNA